MHSSSTARRRFVHDERIFPSPDVNTFNGSRTDLFRKNRGRDMGLIYCPFPMLEQAPWHTAL